MLDMDARARPVVMEFPNGIRLSVITNGYGSEQGLYEVMATYGNFNVTNLHPSGDGHGIYGWLTPEDLAELVTAAATRTHVTKIKIRK